LGNEDEEFSVNDTSTKGIVLAEEIVHLAENVVIGLGIVCDVIFEGSLELLAVNINTEGIVQSDLILGGIFTIEDGLEDGEQLSTLVSEPVVGVVNNIFNG